MDEKDVSETELKEAFSLMKEESAGQMTTKSEPKAKKKPNRKKSWGIVVFVLGLLSLTAGVTFLLFNLLKGPGVRDAEFLVTVGAWQREDEPTVIWNFTEIGKGTLTTNFHINDYEFIWRIDGETLKIETDWLYELNDEYAYKLDQGGKRLTITSGDNSYTFVPSEVPTEKEPEEETN